MPILLPRHLGQTHSPSSFTNTILLPHLATFVAFPQTTTAPPTIPNIPIPSFTVFPQTTKTAPTTPNTPISPAASPTSESPWISVGTQINHHSNVQPSQQHLLMMLPLVLPPTKFTLPWTRKMKRNSHSLSLNLLPRPHLILSIGHPFKPTISHLLGNPTTT